MFDADKAREFIESSRNGDMKRLKELLDSGINVNIQDEVGATALTWASYCGDIEMVRELIQAGADMNIKDTKGKTALNYAKDNGHNDMIELLEKEKGR